MVDESIYTFALVVYIAAIYISAFIGDSLLRMFADMHLGNATEINCLLSFGTLFNIVVFILPAINTIFQFNYGGLFVWTIQYYIADMTPYVTIFWSFILVLTALSDKIKTSITENKNYFGIVLLPWAIIMIFCHWVFITKSIALIK